MVLRVGACGAVSDSEVESDGTVAARGVSECMGGSVDGDSVCSTINPSVAVAMVLRVDAYSTVANGEVESDGAVASRSVGQRVGGSVV